MTPVLGLVFFLTSYLALVYGHGYLLDPVARSTAWLVDQSFRECCTYTNHMQMSCGGLQHQWHTNGGKCGICGEPYDTVNKLFEKGGAMYTDKIVKTYNQGQQIDVTVVLTANHMGYFEFRLCNLDNDSNSDATQECLDHRLLTIADTNLTKFRDVGKYGSQEITIRIQLPSDVTCRHCVFQWKYTTGNNWGTDPITGQSGVGMGIENETFMGCSDISIVDDDSSIDTIPPTILPTDTSIASRPPATTAETLDTTSSRPTLGPTTWSSNGVKYKTGDIVLYDGLRFQCVLDHTSFPGAEPGILTGAWWKRID